MEKGTDPAAPRLGTSDVDAIRVEPVILGVVDVLVELESHAVSRTEAAASAVDAKKRFLRVGGCLLDWGRGSQEGEDRCNDCKAHFERESKLSLDQLSEEVVS